MLITFIWLRQITYFKKGMITKPDACEHCTFKYFIVNLYFICVSVTQRNTCTNLWVIGNREPAFWQDTVFNL